MDLETWKKAQVQFSRLKPQDATLRAIVPHNFAGAVVGFKGTTARRIQEVFNVFLQVYSTDARWGRVISILGSPVNLGRAWRECAYQLIEAYHPHYERFGFEMNFILPSDLVDLFILQDDFQRISSASYTKILVKNAYVIRSTERVVQVVIRDLSKQSLDSFEKCVHLLADIIQANLTISLCSPGNVFYAEDKADDIQSYIKNADPDDLTFFPKAQRLRNQHITPSTEIKKNQQHRHIDNNIIGKKEIYHSNKSQQNYSNSSSNSSTNENLENDRQSERFKQNSESDDKEYRTGDSGETKLRENGTYVDGIKEHSSGQKLEEAESYEITTQEESVLSEETIVQEENIVLEKDIVPDDNIVLEESIVPEENIVSGESTISIPEGSASLDTSRKVEKSMDLAKSGLETLSLAESKLCSPPVESDEDCFHDAHETVLSRQNTDSISQD